MLSGDVRDVKNGMTALKLTTSRTMLTKVNIINKDSLNLMPIEKWAQSFLNKKLNFELMPVWVLYSIFLKNLDIS